MNLTPPRRYSSHRRAGKRRGAAVVEFALVAPLFFLVVFAMFEFSWLNVVRHTADNAAYEAARKAMVPGATVAEVAGEATRILRTIGARGAVVSVSPDPIAVGTGTVTVAIDIPMQNNALVSPRFTATTTIHAESTLRTERVATR